MLDILSSILPVATLLLGAGLANFLKLSELRRSQCLDAADQLAELPALLWDKTDPDAWVKLNTAVSRLSIRLNLAGVHPNLTERVRESAVAFWRSVEMVYVDVEDGEVWSANTSSSNAWDAVSATVAELLGTSSRIKAWRLGRRARRRLKKQDGHEPGALVTVDKTEG